MTDEADTSADDAAEKKPQDTHSEPEPEQDTGDDAVTIVEKPEVAPGVPGRILDEALTQLRRLGELREQEIKRHELIIAEMRENVRRHARFSRLLITICLGSLVLMLLLAGAVHRLRQDQNRTRDEVHLAVTKVGQATGLIRDTSQRAQIQLENVSSGLSSQTRTIEEVRSDLKGRIEQSLLTLRQERDAVQEEVRDALDKQNEDIVKREFALRDEEIRIAQEAERARQERLRIIGEAIDKLSAMATEIATIPADESEAAEAVAEVEQAVAAETAEAVAEVEQAVAAVEADRAAAATPAEAEDEPAAAEADPKPADTEPAPEVPAAPPTPDAAPALAPAPGAAMQI